jgi:hypothetical protein
MSAYVGASLGVDVKAALALALAIPVCALPTATAFSIQLSVISQVTAGLALDVGFWEQRMVAE